MFFESNFGSLVDILSGGRWSPTRVVHELTNRVAYFQSHGMSPSDRVLMHYGNCQEFFVDLLAIWSLGGCAIPLDPRLSDFEVETLALAAAPRFSLWRDHSVTDAAIRARLSGIGIMVLETAPPSENGGPKRLPPSSPVPLSMDQPALILFTSGTTGQPRGVVHSHRSLQARWTSLRKCLSIDKFQRTLCLLPTHFGHGLICNSLFPWLSGQDLFVAPPFRPDLIMRMGSLLDDHEITFMSSVPSIWRLALKTSKPPSLGRLEQVFCGSAPLSAFLWKSIQEWSGIKDVYNAYGITEVASWVAGISGKDATLEDGLVGRPWGATIKILDSSTTDVPPGVETECTSGEPGYVWVKTPSLMSGYLGHDNLTSKVVSDGWLFTGDVGFVDARGFLYLRGRVREVINKGGTKIYPSDIDVVAEKYAQILDVCTFGYEEPLLGEDIGIAVVLKTASDEHFQGAFNWLKAHLAQFQMPQRWYLLDEIPRTSRGKVNRSHVAKMCAGLTPIDHIKVMRQMTCER